MIPYLILSYDKKGESEGEGWRILPETRLADDGKRLFSAGRCVYPYLILYKRGGLGGKGGRWSWVGGWRMTGSASSALDVA